MQNYKYQAFISYSHENERAAARLQKALEAFAVPKHLKQKFPKGLTPVFRDTTELTAHHDLSEKIQEAVEHSRYLIVLCSPAAKTSHWVNEEIKLFRKLHGEASILCCLIDGKPDTSFPPALTEQGREPLAADLSNTNFKFGVTQVAASMMGLGLDDLVQRERQRLRRRMTAITSFSVIGMLIMATLTWTAVDARDEAETSRSEAEKMVEFILSDLQSDLDPIGKLDILETVGDRVLEYYNAIPISDMDEERMTRQARALHTLGDVAIAQGDFENAETHIARSFNLTDLALRQNPKNPNIKQAHGKSNYWYSSLHLQQDNPELAIPFAETFIKTARSLYEIDSENSQYIFDYAYGLNNRGYIYYEMGDYKKSIDYYRQATQVFDNAKTQNIESTDIKVQRAQQINNIAVSYLKLGKIDTGLEYFTNAITVMEAVYNEDPKDKNHLDTLMMMKLWQEHTNITRAKNCVSENIYELVLELETLIDLDVTNRYWVSDYIELLYRALQECSPVINSEWLVSRIEKLENITRSNTILTDGALKKIAWIIEQGQ